MARSKAEIEMVSFGRYTKWNRESKELPRIQEFTTNITATTDVEFGYILRIKRAKGKKIEFIINHPPFNDNTGKTAAPFIGHQYIQSNDYQFFIGDCIWEPIDDKCGEWEITTILEDEIIAKKIFSLTIPN